MAEFQPGAQWISCVESGNDGRCGDLVFLDVDEHQGSCWWSVHGPWSEEKVDEDKSDTKGAKLRAEEVAAVRLRSHRYCSLLKNTLRERQGEGTKGQGKERQGKGKTVRLYKALF